MFCETKHFTTRKNFSDAKFFSKDHFGKWSIHG